MAEQKYDLLVIGSGPGGYVAGIRATQLGMKVGVIEKEKPGGVCLNVGCIPSKALIHQAEIYGAAKGLADMGVSVDPSGLDYSKVFRKSRTAADRLSKGVTFLLKKNKIDYIEGTAKLSGRNTVSVESSDGTTEYSAKNILIATGSRPREIPGFEFDEDLVLSSTGLLMLEKLPKKLVVLGAGAIGMEFAHVMNSFGVEVTIVEMLDRVLPIEDPDAVAVLASDFRKRGIRMLTSTRAQSLERGKKGVKVSVSGPEGGEVLEADKLLVAVGRQPNSENLGLEELGIRSTRGFIETGDYYQTAIAGIYAIGDVIQTPLLAHLASKEGEIAVEHMAGHTGPRRVHPDEVPSAVYTEPGIGSFGPSEPEAKERGLNFKAYQFPYRGAGKSVAIEQPEGIVKLIIDADTHEILGGHVAGSAATELIHELLLAKKSELLPEDVATMVHAHPTLSEAVMEAARAAEGWAIHA